MDSIVSKGVFVVDADLVRAEIVSRSDDGEAGGPVETIAEAEVDEGPEVVVDKTGFTPLAREYDGRIRVFDEFDVTGKSFCEGSVEDFVRYFRDRFERLSAVLRTRPHLNLKPLDRLPRLAGEEVDVLVMVYEVRESKKGNLIATVEDLDGHATVVIPKTDKKLAAKAESLLPDDVVVLHGRVSSNGMLIVQDIYWPDVSEHTPHYADVPLSVAVTSDWHVGSRLHIEKAVRKFIDWLKGKVGSRRLRELAGTVKYIIVNGDVVDGVGVYPSQVDELEIRDIYRQYDAFARYLDEIPDYIEVIVGPGNHDAVRRLEPQPALAKDIAAPLYERDNVTLVGSPAYFSLDGVEFLTYHGTSMDDVISRVPYLDYTTPQEALKEYLRHRHLAITYGLKNPIVPEKKDYLVIDRIPDVLTAGHVHKNGYGRYKNVSLIVS
ncbi:TPA: DNA polymerase II small subunit, partial [Candidatus Micrarchaeota archaeon]|nr:DNA polymerase II small subunit [Candidatus Micrarchaeota archaeon]